MSSKQATTNRYDAWAHVIRALANPTRLFLIEELMKGTDRCVCELSDLAGGEMSSISRHLAILREAGILQEYRRGRMAFYHVRSPNVATVLECAECCLRSAGQD